MIEAKLVDVNDKIVSIDLPDDPNEVQLNGALGARNKTCIEYGEWEVLTTHAKDKWLVIGKTPTEFLFEQRKRKSCTLGDDEVLGLVKLARQTPGNPKF